MKFLRTCELLPPAHPRSRGFSLTEVVLALGIVAFGLVAIIGLIPVALTSLNDSVEDTSTELLLENVRASLVGQPFVPGAQSEVYYDKDGGYLGDNPADEPTPAFRVRISLAAPFDPPPNTDILVASVAVERLSKGTSGPVVSTVRRSFYVAPRTGSGWSALDPAYQPKIGL